MPHANQICPLERVVIIYEIEKRYPYGNHAFLKSEELLTSHPQKLY